MTQTHRKKVKKQKEYRLLHRLLPFVAPPRLLTFTKSISKFRRPIVSEFVTMFIYPC